MKVYIVLVHFLDSAPNCDVFDTKEKAEAKAIEVFTRLIELEKEKEVKSKEAESFLWAWEYSGMSLFNKVEYYSSDPDLNPWQIEIEVFGKKVE